jgi:hypothetical protein
MFLSQLFIDLESMHLDYDKAQEAKTLKGFLSNILGYLFSFYCIFKTIMSFLNILMNPTFGQDPTTRILNFFVHKLGFQLDLEFWTSNISFLVVGLMAVFAIRGFLLQLAKLTEVTAFNTDLPILFVTQLMGFYLQSVMLMLRISLPKQYRYALLILIRNDCYVWRCSHSILFEMV